MSHNQLSDCNVRPNHRPLCSLISQHTTTPEMGMISTSNQGTTGSHIAHIHQNIVKPTYIWVSQTIQGNKPKHNKTQPHQLTVRLITLLRKWKGTISKLVSSTTDPWVPTQYLAWPPQFLHHPAQGSIPFIATQSLRPCLPFQCSSGCA